MAQEEVIITVNMPAGLVEQATGMATEGAIPKISAEAIAEAIISRDPAAKKELEQEQKKAVKLLKERHRAEERQWKEMLREEKEENDEWQRMLKAERDEHIAFMGMLVKEQEDNLKAAQKAAKNKEKDELKAANAEITKLINQQKRLLQEELDAQAKTKKEKADAEKELKDEINNLAIGYKRRAKDEEESLKSAALAKAQAAEKALSEEQLEVAALVQKEKRLLAEDLDDQARRKKELSDADKALKDEVEKLAAGYKRRAAEEEAEAKKKGKDKLSPADQADLDKLIKQNKRGYDEEMAAPASPGESPSVLGDFFTRMGSGLAGHHGGLRSLLGAGLKGLGGSIGGTAGAAGGAAGGGGGAAAGAAAGAPLGPLGIAAGVVIGKIAGDTIGKAMEVFMDGAKMIYNSGEKFTEAGAAYSSILQGATQRKMMKELEFAMNLDASSGSLGRFYNSTTDLEISSQEAILEIFKLLEPVMTTGVITVTDLLRGIAIVMKATEGPISQTASAMSSTAGLAGIITNWWMRSSMERAAEEAKKNEGVALENMANFLGMKGNFKGGKADFKDAKDFMGANQDLFRKGMGFN